MKFTLVTQARRLRSVLAIALCAMGAACLHPAPAASSELVCPAGQELHEEKYPSGHVRERGCITPGPKIMFIKQGEWVTFYESGKLKFRGTYKDRLLEGLATTWYETGEKLWEAVYKDDFIEGTRTAWYPNGQKKEEATAFNRKLQGADTSWYANGQKKEETFWVDGKKEGLNTRWYENGKKWGESSSRAGLQQGRAIGWAEDGSVEYDLMYHDDKPVPKGK